jgi:tRNA (guanine-N7-)-methyltransferase
METLLPELEINLKKLELPKKKSVWLEIGFGGGEHLAAQAAANPDVAFIGCEPFVNGVASLLDHIDKQKLKNIRVFPDDARHLLDALPDRSIEKCFVLFADPWPKKRHVRRRFIGPDTLPRLARVMSKGSELRLATDDMRLAAWMKDSLAASPDFELTREAHMPPADWVQTRYEDKALQAGRKPVYLTYRRC